MDAKEKIELSMGKIERAANRLRKATRWLQTTTSIDECPKRHSAILKLMAAYSAADEALRYLHDVKDGKNKV